MILMRAKPRKIDNFTAECASDVAAREPIPGCKLLLLFCMSWPETCTLRHREEDFCRGKSNSSFLRKKRDQAMEKCLPWEPCLQIEGRATATPTGEGEPGPR